MLLSYVRYATHVGDHSMILCVSLSAAWHRAAASQRRDNVPLESSAIPQPPRGDPDITPAGEHADRSFPPQVHQDSAKPTFQVIIIRWRLIRG